MDSLLYSYDPSLATPLDTIRFTIGDTDMPARSPEDAEAETRGNAMLSNQEIEGALAAEGLDVDRATLRLAIFLILRYANEPDQVTAEKGEIVVSWKDRLAGWRMLVAEIKGRIAESTQATSGGFRMRKPTRGCEPLGEYTRERGWR